MTSASSHPKPSSLLCIAHRGGRSLGVENSLKTIATALDMSVDAIEIDVWKVAGELWVTHDRYLGRVLQGYGRITEVEANQIALLKDYDQQPIATLKQVMELIGDRARLNIEIKGPDCAPLVAQQVLAHCQKNKIALENYIISSFDHQQLYWLKQHHPQLLRGVLICTIPLDYAQCCVELGAYSFHPNVDFINQQLVDDALKRKLKVWVYTVNEMQDFIELAAMGVEGVFTDFPDRLIAYNQAL